jgi:recombination protein RecA
MFIDAEFSYDQNWAKSLGVDTERLYVYKENDGTKIFDRLVGIPKKDGVGKLKKGVLDIEIEMGGTGLGIIVLDSIAAMQAPIEQNNAVSQQDMAPMARFLPKALRRLTPLLSQTGVTLIAINQLRMKPGVMYGNPEESPGGTALKFACSQMVNLAKINAKESALMNEADEQVGHHIRARIDKNKKAPPHRTAEFAIKYLSGIADRNIEVLDLGAKYGVICRPNNRTYELDGVKYNGKDAIADALLDTDLQENVMTRVKEAKANNVSVAVLDDEQSEEE